MLQLAQPSAAGVIGRGLGRGERLEQGALERSARQYLDSCETLGEQEANALGGALGIHRQVSGTREERPAP